MITTRELAEKVIRQTLDDIRYGDVQEIVKTRDPEVLSEILDLLEAARIEIKWRI